MNYTDVTIDLETLGDTPDSIPCQMGVVFFDLHNPHRTLIGGEADIDHASASELGLISTTSTMEWYADKGLPIPGMFGPSHPISEVLANFATSFKTLAAPDARVWSRGTSFDLAILKLCFHRLRIPLPWQFWRESDVRTYLFARTGSIKGRPNAHTALSDALNEVRDLHDAANPTTPSFAQELHNTCLAAHFAKLIA